MCYFWISSTDYSLSLLSDADHVIDMYSYTEVCHLEIIFGASLLASKINVGLK